MHSLVVMLMVCQPLSHSLTAYAQPPAHLPTDPTVVHGNATFDTVGDHMTVVNNPGAILDWHSFSIGSNQEVHFQQLNATSQVLNRVIGDDPSQILGSLSSNGGVWLINSHGVLFGQSARIDVAGLVTSTLDISNIDFLAGKYNFLASSADAGQVANQGDIRTSFGGRVWLIGDQVRNEGMIQTPGGNIVLAAGKSLELVDSGAPNIIVRITAPENEVANLGSLVSSSGGTVDLHGSIVNQQGIVRADSVGVDAGGRISLKASQALALKEGSEIRSEGGTVTMSAGTSTYLAGLVDVSRQLGTGGSIQLTTGSLEGMAGGTLRAVGQQGGDIQVGGQGMVGFSSSLSAAGTVQGGTVGVTGDRVYLLNADVDASGGAHGGTIHLGGGWQGGGSLAHARQVLIGMGSNVSANSALGSNGGGGEVVVWSTQSSQHYGTLQAREGGRIELSSLGEIHQTGSIQAGVGGTVLFDPKNLIIADNPPDNLAMAKNVVGSSSGGTQPDSSNSFGFATALDGDRLAVGAGLENNARGAVYLFNGVGSNFSGLTLLGKIDSGAFGTPALEVGGQFGSSLSLDGGLLAVGAPLTDSSNGSESGSVYLFNGASSADFSGLTYVTTLASDPNFRPLGADDHFGFAVALDGQNLAVGAGGDDTGGSNRGAVYLFNGVGTDFSGLTQKRIVTSNSGLMALNDQDFFGRAVDLDGDRLAIGAPGGAPVDSDSSPGAVYLFTGVDTANFAGLALRSKLAVDSGIPNLVVGDGFGFAVALNNNHVVVGAPGDDTGGSNRGGVYIFSGIGANLAALNQQKKIITGSGANGMLNLEDNDQFGLAVALDGDLLAVGATGLTAAPGRSSVYLFGGMSTLPIDVEGAIFDPNSSADSYITPGALTAVLDTGTAVILQANNDITISSPISTNIDDGDSGGNLTLQAGRHIRFDADILTDGDLVAVAGDPAASALKDTGIPTLTISPGISLNVGTGTATLAAVNGNFVNLSGSSAISTTGNGRWLIYTSDPNSATFGGLSSGSLALWNHRYPDNPPSSITQPGNRYLFGITQTLTFTSASLIKTYGDDVTPSLVADVTGANNNTYGGAVIADNSLPFSSLFSGAATVGSAGAVATANVSGSPYAITVGPGTLSSLTGYGTAFNSTGTITVNPYAVTLTGTRPYDGTTNVAASMLNFGPLVGSETLALSGSGTVADKLVGSGKTVNTAGLALINDTGVASNYIFASGIQTIDISSLALTGSITAADKTYDGTPAATITGRTLSGVLESDSVEYVGGTANFIDLNVGLNKLVTATGLGLSGADAGNYIVNTTATATADILPEVADKNPSFTQNTVQTSIQSINVAMLGAFPILDWSTLGYVVDMTSRAPNFGRLDLSRMSRAEMQQLVDMRREFKEKLFADAIYKLEQDPSLANVRPCPSLSDINTGLCRITDAQRLQLASNERREESVKEQRRAKVARLPQIERKFVILFGIDQYADKTIPPLENAVFDAEVVGKLFADKLGYEARVVKNATKADIVRTLNQLSTEMRPHDSVIIYYAGHGYRNDKTVGGYWIPSDASISDASTWISNTDVSKMLADIRAKQIVMIADSCYSGTFAEQKLGLSGGELKPEEVLAKRSVIVMSSGGDEPVADEGRGGHSIFAWDLMQALRNVDNWQPGTSIFEQVKRDVMKSFPQTPQYGTIKSAGHEKGGEYLFEFRQLE